MKSQTKRTLQFAAALLALSTIIYQPLTVFAQGTAFTYQGRLNDGTNPAGGNYDFKFSIFATNITGTIIAGPVTNSATPVSNGLFIATLDFGANFPGAARWLEIAVRTNGGGAFTNLSPRQQITPTPYAITASNLTGTLLASQLTGTLPSAQLGGTYSSALTFNNAGNSFSGNGSGLTSLNLSGTYSSAVNFNNGGNTFSGSFSGNGSGLSSINALYLGGFTANQFWQITGNSGTTAGPNFVGTTDNQPLELHVFGQRALRLEPDLTPNLSPNVIGGSIGNAVILGRGATIGGGGQILSPNIVMGAYPVVAGGFGNTAVDYATVSGGTSNLASGLFSVIGGGSLNSAANEAVVSGGVSNLATAVYSTISGGYFNRASNSLATVSGGGYNVAGGYASVVAGGGGVDQFFNPLVNLATGDWSTVGGGQKNTASGNSATVAGGNFNRATGTQSTVGGGTGHHSDASYSTVGGGFYNTADAYAATVSGGEENGADSLDATVGGGVGNYASGTNSTIGGGGNNLAEGAYSTVPGGRRADPTQYGQLAHAAGMFRNPGDAQHSIYVMRTSTTNSFAQMALDGITNLLTITTNRSMTFHILIVARADPAFTNDTAGYEIKGVIKYDPSSPVKASFVGGAPIVTVLGQDPGTNPYWTVGIGTGFPPNGNQLIITVGSLNYGVFPFTPPFIPVRWVARVDAAEVAW